MAFSKENIGLRMKKEFNNNLLRGNQMMGKLKKVVCLLLAMMLFVGCNPNQFLAASKYGFTYDTASSNVTWKTMYSFNVYSGAGGKLGTCSYVIGLTRSKGTNDYVLMTREVMTPNSSQVKINNVQYGYGFSEYVSIKVTLPSLDDYRPQNTPSSDTISFSIGADSDGASVGASYSITHSDLDITASCDTSSKLYHVKYNYNPTIANPFGNNKYLANESVQLGAAAFHNSSDTVSFKINYDARFGAAEDNAASPWLVYMNYVQKATTSRTYSFSVAKN